MLGAANAATAKPTVTREPTSRRPVADSSEGVARPERRLLVALQHVTRYAPNETRSRVSELTIPHGLVDFENRAGILAQTGGLISDSDAAPTVVTMLLALEYEPLPWVVAPFVDVGAGGYLVLGRGAGRTEAPRIEWLWSSCASAGIKAYLSRLTGVPLDVRAFGQAFWVEQPYVPLPVVFSGWGFGFGVEYRFDVPDVHLIRQFSHGEGMADGW